MFTSEEHLDDLEGREPDRPLVPAVTRAVAILDLLSTDREPLGVTAIARRLGLPKSSVANICGALTDGGLLRPNGTGYSLGQRVVQLSAAYLSGVNQVQLFHDACAELDVASRETVQLAVLGDRLDVLYIARREGSYPVRLASTLGRALPASCTGTGKAMLAELPPGELNERLDNAGPLPSLTSNSITEAEPLLEELARIRRHGFALDNEEVIEGVVCVAVAVPGLSPSGQRLALSVTLLKPRASDDVVSAIARELQEIAPRISTGLGFDHR
jgi:DNA-binding IclR family transcriptional regulator